VTKWKATWRCDLEEEFCTDFHVYELDTQTLSEAALFIEQDIGCRGTLISLEREL
jgi:hypothetical protein